jgi:hypothetical protein
VAERLVASQQGLSSMELVSLEIANILIGISRLGVR